jgi:hypothetical protein
MANTYTPTYNLILPEVGSDTNAWGGHLNTNTSTIDTNMFSRSTLAAQTVLSAVTWSGNQTFNGTASFAQTLSVSGAVTFSATLALSGAATIGGTLGVTGVATFTSNCVAATAPTTGSHLTNKTYTDATYLPFVGGTLTGNLSIISGTTEMTVTVGSSGGYFYGNATQIGWKASGGSAKVYWDTSGNLTAAANITAYSDAKLKTNVETIKEALSIVERMRGVFYQRIDSGEHGVGVIAQEMQEVLPQVVIENDGLLSVAYGNIVGVLIEAVKELSTKVDALEASK